MTEHQHQHGHGHQHHAGDAEPTEGQEAEQSAGLPKGTQGVLIRQDQPPAEAEVVRYQAGRDAGDHLIQFVDGGEEGVVTRKWYVVRPAGTNENGTFEPR